MHVCWLSESPVIASGYGTQSRQIIKKFIQQGHKVSVIGLNHPVNRVEKFDGFTVYPLHRSSNTHDFKKIWKNLRSSVDILVTFLDIHFIHYIFSSNEKDIREHSAFAMYHLWDNEPAPKFNLDYYNSVDKVICGSESSYKLLKNLGVDASLVSLGADERVFKPLSNHVVEPIRKSILSNAHNDINFIIGSVNANILRKRLADLVVAYSKFVEDKTDVGLLLHCRADDSRGVNLKKIISDVIPFSKNHNILFSRSKSQPTDYINRLYNLCDVSINLSHSEGFGLQTVESMLAGVPPVVGDFGNHPHMVDNVGWRIKPAVSHITGGFGADYIYEHYISEKDIVDTLNEIYNNRDILKSKKNRCREQGMKFSLDRTAKGLLKEFQAIVDDRKDKPYSTIRVSAV